MINVNLVEHYCIIVYIDLIHQYILNKKYVKNIILMWGLLTDYFHKL
jgi:hypothetical protein